MTFIYLKFLNPYRTRLAKVYGEKFREFPRDLKAHGDQNKNNPHYNKLDGNQKLQADAVSNKTEAKLFNKDIPGAKIKRDIVRFSILFTNSFRSIIEIHNYIIHKYIVTKRYI